MTGQRERRTHPCQFARAEALAIIKFHSGSMVVLLFGTPKALEEPVLLFVYDTGWPRGNKFGEKVDVLAGIGTNGQEQEGLVQKSKLPGTVSHALLPLGEVHVPFPPGSGKKNGSYYS
jgi:hypothetical protein